MRRLGPLLVLATVLAGCTREAGSPPVSFDPKSPGEQGGTGRIKFEAFLECCFVEGGVFVVLVENAEGGFVLATSETFADRHLRSSTPVRSGDLTVYTWSLDCLEADCDMIEFDPPESACRTDLHLEDGETLRLSVKDPMVTCEVLHRVTN